MYILFFFFELINIYVIFNVALKSVSWFTASIQIPTLNYLNNIVNGPTKYLLLPHLYIDMSDNNTSDDNTSDNNTSDNNTSDNNTSDNNTDDDVTDDDDMTDDDVTDDDVTYSKSSDDMTECESSDNETIKEDSEKLYKLDEKLEQPNSKEDSSDSEDEIKSLLIKPSVIIMDEKLD